MRFADASRGGDGEGYEDYGYGYIVSAAGGELTLCGSQDVLGTYFGTRTFALRDGAFEFADDGLWHFDTSAVDWENRALDPIADIPATFVDGGAETAGVIEAGTRFAVAASDKVSIVYFVTEDGREGFFPIEPDPRGWGVLVNGVSEDELFAFVPMRTERQRVEDGCAGRRRPARTERQRVEGGCAGRRVPRTERQRAEGGCAGWRDPRGLSASACRRRMRRTARPARTERQRVEGGCAGRRDPRRLSAYVRRNGFAGRRDPAD